MSRRHGFSAFRQAAAVLRGLARALARDQAGNTIMIVAFSLIPILAMIGGGIDMGRGYLSQSRLQQACDAGVLAARKKQGNTIPVTNVPTTAVQSMGDQFFDLNFQSGAYGTASRTFSMNVESDASVTGTATVTVPTTLMRLFGFTALPISVTCQAKINFSNTDVMMVLDTTGSMRDTNPSDTKPKIDVLRDTVKSFYAQLEAQKGAGTRIRYGFVPYSVNVNVGFLLKSSWLADSWSYHGRVTKDTGLTKQSDNWKTDYTYISGSQSSSSVSDQTSCPSSTDTWVELAHWTDPDGTENWTYQVNGASVGCSSAPENKYNVYTTTYNNYTYTYSQKYLGKKTVPWYTWHYGLMSENLTALKDANPNNPPAGGKISVPMGGDPNNVYNYDAYFNGCIEERATYEINDYTNVDLTRALDLDIDLVPTANVNTQWKMAMPDIAWAHSTTWSSYNWTPAGEDYDGDFIETPWAGYGVCPSAAQKLQTMTSAQVATYVDGLVTGGNTYHDIGMIWGGRLLSPTGIFAAENADLSTGATRRNLIFLTDGLTAPNELTYGAYGIDPLDQRRWSEASALSLTQTVEGRFTAACNEVKKKNITVWVIAFGQTLNPVLSDCAGTGHAFYASDASSLTNIFSTIAASMGDLRVSQ